MDTTRNTTEACLPCTVCAGATLSECTPTSNTVCDNPVVPLTDSPTPPCNPGFYYNVFHGENECLRCTVCVAYSSRCTATRDASCAADPMVEFAELVYFYFTSVFGSAILALYIVLPAVEYRYGNSKPR